MDQQLKELAEQLDANGWAAELLDHRWHLVWVSDELLAVYTSAGSGVHRAARAARIAPHHTSVSAATAASSSRPVSSRTACWEQVRSFIHTSAVVVAAGPPSRVCSPAAHS
jgi:hypothetical protein